MGSWTPRRAAGMVLLCAAWGGCSGTPAPQNDRSQESTSALPAPVDPQQGTATPAPPSAPPSAASGAMIVGPARLEGTLGQVVDMTTDGAVARLDPYDSRAVRVEATDSAHGWWVMTAFPLPAGLDAPALHPGAVLEFSVADGDNGDGGLIFPPFGCSGPSPDNFTVDIHAHTLTVRVTEGQSPGTYHLAFDEVFGAGPSPWRLQGGFDYRP